MKRRIFIAINLPEDIKKKLLEFRKKWDFLDVRWTKRDSLHLTLVFIGYVSDEEVYEICKITKEIAQKYEPFFINFEKILYGPPSKDELSSGKPPRMIWLEGRASEELSKIKQSLENALTSSEKVAPFKIERRPFSPHITLARIHPHTLKNVNKYRTSEGKEIEQCKEFQKNEKGVGVKMGEWHKLDEVPEIKEDFRHNVPVASLDVMESDLKRDGAEYTILESCPLGS